MKQKLYEESMKKKLTETEIQKRLARLANLEVMYVRQVDANKRLKEENKQLKARIVELEAENKALHERVQNLELMVEELHRMIFKKKKKKEPNEKISEWTKKINSQRSAESYRRAIPEQKNITTKTCYPISCCPDCNSGLKKRKTVLRYVEDMILPTLDTAVLNTTIQEEIEKWYCEWCKQWKAAKTISSQLCTIWSWVKGFVVYAYTVLRLSYEQIQWFLEMFVHIRVSDGEIVHILKENARRLRWEYEEIKARIRLQPCAHYDETWWDIQADWWKQYAWVMSDIEGKERVYVLWETRAKSVVEELKWETKQIGISDDYNAYSNTFEHHQLCWAHPIRKLRDLKDSSKLNHLQRVWAEVTYTAFCNVHEKVKALSTIWKVCNQNEVDHIKQKLRDITEIYEHDVWKMITIKKWIRNNLEKYLTCLKFTGVPTTNNTAERVLRPLVIKRKLSFWSKTHDWASMMEILYSVMYSFVAKFGNATFTHFLSL